MLYRRKFIIYILTAVFLLWNGPNFKADEKEGKEKWEIDDVLKMERAGSFEFSPDGNAVVWVKTVADKEKGESISHIFLTSLKKKGETIQLTRGESSERSPKWSPSGKLISFLCERKGTVDKESASGSQLWLMDTRGGEPWKVTSHEFGVFDYEWLDENRVLMISREDKTLLEQDRKEKKDTALIVEDQEHMIPKRLYIFDIEKKKLTRLTENKDEITGFYLSYGKKWVVTENNQSVRYEVDKKIKPKYYLINIGDRSSKEIFPDPKFKPESIYWALDDSGFYFTHKRTSDYENDGPGASFPYFYKLADGTHSEIPINWDWGLFYFGIHPRKDGFVASLANGAVPKWRRYYKSSGSYKFEELEGKHYPHIFGLVLDEKSNKALYYYTTASTPGQWYYGTLKDNELKSDWQLMEINSHIKNKKLAKTEVIKWIGALEDKVEGVLYYPHDYEEGKKFPLMLIIHGGPTGIDMDSFHESWAEYPNLIAQRGAFVFLVNYHGSTGYGQKFVESIKGHYYEYEIPDILSGIDKLVKEGKVDPDRLGTMGWSNGGILTIALTTWTDRFKVAGVGAADVNWVSDYGNCAFGVSFDNYYFTGSPWDSAEHYLKKSPIFHLKDMKIPTIIFHGTEDTNVPYEQGWEYYRALQQIGKAPVKFLVFPGEPHGLRKIPHQKRKMEEEIAWFDRYFFNTYKPENEAFKTGSPLDMAIKKSKFAREGSYYGRPIKSVLVPELVKKDALEVGRFEVTRAQWAAFDKDYKFDPASGNYPVTGITFDQAEKYAAWLKEMTGEDYRLPSVKEVEKLASSASTGGNTLNYWAGYSINRDDAVLFMEKVNSSQLSLLLPVDEPGADGEEMIYGLGGNAAEWAVDDKGVGKITGKYAAAYSDDRGEYPPVPAEYAGIRIVKGKPTEKKDK